MRFPKTIWVFCLPESIQQQIWEALEARGLSYEDRARGMAGRLCDLEDTIEIGEWCE